MKVFKVYDGMSGFSYLVAAKDDSEAINKVWNHVGAEERQYRLNKFKETTDFLKTQGLWLDQPDMYTDKDYMEHIEVTDDFDLDENFLFEYAE